MGLALALVLIALVPIQMASGQTTPTPVPFDAGNLKLHMNTDGSYFRYVDENGTTVANQPFSANAKCQYVAGSSGNSLMTPSAPAPGTTAKPGYQQKDNGYGLGVNPNAKASNGCDQTNLNEKLALELQNDASGSPVEGLYIDHAELNIEFKYNAVLSVQFLKDGQAIGAPVPYNCSGSDCGPDSGGGDNYIVPLVAPGGVLFDRMEFVVTSSNSQAAVTIEGGNDAGTPESNFHLVELLQPIDCNQTVTGSGGGTNAEVTLVNNADCTPKGYKLNVSAKEIELITAGSTEHVQFVVKANAWAPEPAVFPIPRTRAFPPEPDGELLVWCDGDNSKLLGTEGGPTMPTGHSWCLMSQTTAIAGYDSLDPDVTPNITPGTQLMVVTETSLLEADAVQRR